MQNKAIELIKSQQSKFQEDDLEYGIAELMMDMCNTEPQAAELFIQDLEKVDMSIDKCARHLEDYARKNKRGNSYGMGDRAARRIIREFFGIPQPSEQQDTHSGNHARGNVLDLFDLI